MNSEMRCKCGWSGPAGEMTAGRPTCPECGKAIEQDRPYSYPPFPSWQSQRRENVRLPNAHYRGPQRSYGGSRVDGWNALLLGFGALAMSFGRYSWVAAIVLAVAAIVVAGLARRSSAAEHRRRPFKATLGAAAAVVALLVVAVPLMSGRIGCRHARHIHAVKSEPERKAELERGRAEFQERLNASNARLREAGERLGAEKVRRMKSEREKLSQAHGTRKTPDQQFERE